MPMSIEKVDAVIVGSGASGSLLAAKLAQAGKKVLVLEAGPERTAGDLYSSQIWARRLKWSGPRIESVGKHPINVVFGHGWGTGGSALHHYACWFRLHPEDFEVRRNFGVGLNWPIFYDELRPFYDRIQKEVGVSGDAKLEVWRPPGEPYPMPPLQTFAQAHVIARGFEKLGLRTAPLPMAINSMPYNGRPPCAYEGWCDAGCPLLALANPLAVYLSQAHDAGAVVAHHAYVSRVLTNEKGDRASAVEYFNAQGKRQVQEANLVVLASSALQNPRILLNSATPRQSSGLANSSGAVGRYMMTHIAGNAFGLFQEPTENYRGVTGGQLVCQEDYAKDRRKGYLGSSQWLIANALKPNDLLGIGNARPELFGDALHKFLATASQHLATMTFVGENQSKAENQLVLSRNKDSFGFPLAHITHEFSTDDLKCFDTGMKQGQAIMKAAGAYEAWSNGPVSMHDLGGTVMGSDGATSVVNSYGQTHDVSNLFVAGPGIFPTSGAVNPTFTIHAVTLRAADYIQANWSSLS
jgi:choline dehydrogenase-like flavoprotein